VIPPILERQGWTVWHAVGAVALLAGFVLRETRVPGSRAAPAPS